MCACAHSEVEVQDGVRWPHGGRFVGYLPEDLQALLPGGRMHFCSGGDMLHACAQRCAVGLVHASVCASVERRQVDFLRVVQHKSWIRRVAADTDDWVFGRCACTRQSVGA